jgi:hypothetical protein
MIVFAVHTMNAYAGESKVICTTNGELGEQNVFTIGSATKSATESLNEKIVKEEKLGFTLVSSPAISVTSVSTATLKETTINLCVTVTKNSSPEQPANSSR